VISAQFARPRGLLGRLVGRTMARQNAQLTLRVVAALNLRGDETVIEFGPGPGVGLRLLAQALPTGRVIGVEPSPVMRAQAAARTRRFANRVELIDATAETTPLAAGSIDAVCAVNNVQLWQPLPASHWRMWKPDCERAIPPSPGQRKTTASRSTQSPICYSLRLTCLPATSSANG